MNVLSNILPGTRRAAGESVDELPAPRSVVPAWAGIIGPILFTAMFLVQDAFRSDANPIAEPVSALEAGPTGWVQQVSFAVFGLLTMVFAVGLHRGLRRTRAGIAGPALLFVSGIAMELAAIFPLQRDAVGEIFDPGGHTVAGMMFFSTSAVWLILVSRRLARDPRWRSLAGYTLAAGLVGVASFFAMGALVIPDSAPLHSWAGLAQRAVVLLVLFPPRIALAVRLLQVTRATARTA